MEKNVKNQEASACVSQTNVRDSEATMSLEHYSETCQEEEKKPTKRL